MSEWHFLQGLHLSVYYYFTDFDKTSKALILPAEPDEVKGITEETEIPNSFSTPQAVTAIPAVLQPRQWGSNAVSTSKTKEKEGGELEINGK